MCAQMRVFTDGRRRVRAVRVCLCAQVRTCRCGGLHLGEGSGPAAGRPRLQADARQCEFRGPVSWPPLPRSWGQTNRSFFGVGGWHADVRRRCTRACTSPLGQHVAVVACPQGVGRGPGAPPATLGLDSSNQTPHPVTTTCPQTSPSSSALPRSLPSPGVDEAQLGKQPHFNSGPRLAPQTSSTSCPPPLPASAASPLHVDTHSQT